MDALNRAIDHIEEVAQTPSFSTYEERLHPYIYEVFGDISNVEIIHVPGNNVLYRIKGQGKGLVALTAHLDKIDHYGPGRQERLPVKIASKFIEGAMDNSIGVGTLLTMAELTEHMEMPDLLFFFSEMEEFKEHPERLKRNGKGYESGKGAKRIARRCIELNLIPDEIITVDTTPLFKGKPGVALYSKHWELNDLVPADALIKQTKVIEQAYKALYQDLKLDNNTNDYLYYGREFNESGDQVVPSVALEPAIFPYHQKGERVFISDIKKVLDILKAYLNTGS